MCSVVSCPGGCSVRLEGEDIIGWVKHIQKQHPTMLKDWLKDRGIWNGETPMPTKIPETSRTLTLQQNVFRN